MLRKCSEACARRQCRTAPARRRRPPGAHPKVFDALSGLARRIGPTRRSAASSRWRSCRGLRRPMFPCARSWIEGQLLRTSTARCKRNSSSLCSHASERPSGKHFRHDIRVLAESAGLRRADPEHPDLGPRRQQAAQRAAKLAAAAPRAVSRAPARPSVHLLKQGGHAREEYPGSRSSRKSRAVSVAESDSRGMTLPARFSGKLAPKIA